MVSKKNICKNKKKCNHHKDILKTIKILEILLDDKHLSELEIDGVTHIKASNGEKVSIVIRLWRKS